MKLRYIFYIIFNFQFLIFNIGNAQSPAKWEARGIGAGGALFSPSINPANNDEYYVACDMGELFHTTDFGMSYSQVDFRELRGGNYSAVRFTNTPGLLYCINYLNEVAFPAKSTDGGSTWNNLTAYPNEDGAYSFYADYNEPNRLLASDYDFIYFSSDGGKNWINAYTAKDENAGIVVGGVFFDGQMIFIGTNDGLVFSTNGGSSFTTAPNIGIPSNERIYSFAGAKQSGTVRFYILTGDVGDVYAGMSSGDYYGKAKGVYTFDLGQTSWKPASTGIDFDNDFVMLVAMAENDVNTCYLAGSNVFGLPNIMKTNNAGQSWAHIFNTSNNENIITGWSGDGGDREWSYGEVIFGISVAPNNKDRIIISDYGFVHKTSDGGSLWQQAYVDVSNQNMAGVSTPKGKSYHSVGIENTSCWQVFWADKDNMFAAFSDIKGIRSTDAGMSWSFDYTGFNDNTMYRIAQSPSGMLYGCTSTIHDIYQSTRLRDDILDSAGGLGGKILQSSDKGKTWQLVQDFGRPVYWIAIDPNELNKMYASVINFSQNLGGIYFTNDLQNGPGAKWQKLPNPPRTEGHPATIIVLNDSRVLCTYSGRRNWSGAFTPSSGVFLYNPQSSSWADLSSEDMRYWCKDVVLDPNDNTQKTWYVGVYSGWGGPASDKGGLYKTTNGGASWQKIWNDDRVESCTFDPNDPEHIYVTTETKGLWQSLNINSSNPAFMQVENYLFKQPERVFFNPYKPDEVWITSFGNGMYAGSQITGVAQPSTEDKNTILSPNPAGDFVNVEFMMKLEGTVRINVSDILGSELFSVANQVHAGRNNIVIDTRELQGGLYFMKAEFENGNTVMSKLMIVR